MREADAAVTAAPPIRRLAAAAVLAVAGMCSLPAPAAAAAPLSGRSVQALAWFGGTAYAGTDGGLFRLGGSGWVAVPAVPPTRSVQALVVAGTALVAGTDDGAIRSTDGSVWTSAGLSGQSVDSLDAAAGSLFAGTGVEGSANGLALRSDDGGASWAPATAVPAAEGMPGPAVQAILGAASGQPAWAGTAGSGADTSSDGRGGWSDGSAGLGSHWVTALWRDPGAPVHVLAGTDDGLDQRSGGGAWTPVAFPQQDPWVQALATGAGGAPLAGTYDGAVFQQSAGAWRMLGSGLQSVLSLLAVPAAQGGGVLAGTFDGVACLGCSSGVAAGGAAPTARPGATPLPPVAQRPGALAHPPTPPAALSPAPGSVAGSPQGGGAGGSGGGGAPGGGGSGPPHALYLVGAGLVAISAVITALGRRRGRGGK